VSYKANVSAKAKLVGIGIGITITEAWIDHNFSTQGSATIFPKFNPMHLCQQFMKRGSDLALCLDREKRGFDLALCRHNITVPKSSCFRSNLEKLKVFFFRSRFPFARALRTRAKLG
jgi:hypothetical protein